MSTKRLPKLLIVSMALMLLVGIGISGFDLTTAFAAEETATEQTTSAEDAAKQADGGQDQSKDNKDQGQVPTKASDKAGKDAKSTTKATTKSNQSQDTDAKAERTTEATKASAADKNTDTDKTAAKSTIKQRELKAKLIPQPLYQDTNATSGKKQKTAELKRLTSLWESLMARELPATEEALKLEVTVSGKLPEGLTAEARYIALEDSSAHTEQGIASLDVTLLDKSGKRYIPENAVTIAIKGDVLKTQISAAHPLIVYSYASNQARAQEYTEKYAKDSARIYAADVTVAKSSKAADNLLHYETYDPDKTYKNGVDAVRYTEAKDGLKTGNDTVRFAYDFAAAADADKKAAADGKPSASAADAHLLLTAQMTTRTLHAKAGDARITVTGALDPDVTLKVREVGEKDKNYESYVAKTAAALDAKATELDFVRAFDIKLVDPASGKAFESDSDMKVSIDLGEDDLDEDADFDVAHFAGDVNKAPELMDAKTSGDTVKFTAEGFSVYVVAYTVDFHWGDYTYSIAGEDSILLSELFKELGVNEITVADVENVTFSDPKLVKVSKTGLLGTGGDWKLTSLKAFDTDETLTLELKNGEKVAIGVTDEEQYTAKIIFNYNYPVGDNTPETQIVSVGQYGSNVEVSLPSVQSIPGYEFDGWYNQYGKCYNSTDTINISKGETKEYNAKWNPVLTVNIKTFECANINNAYNYKSGIKYTFTYDGDIDITSIFNDSIKYDSNNYIYITAQIGNDKDVTSVNRNGTYKTKNSTVSKAFPDDKEVTIYYLKNKPEAVAVHYVYEENGILKEIPTDDRTFYDHSVSFVSARDIYYWGDTNNIYDSNYSYLGYESVNNDVSNYPYVIDDWWRAKFKYRKAYIGGTDAQNVSDLLDAAGSNNSLILQISSDGSAIKYSGSLTGEMWPIAIYYLYDGSAGNKNQNISVKIQKEWNDLSNNGSTEPPDDAVVSFAIHKMRSVNSSWEDAGVAQVGAQSTVSLSDKNGWEQTITLPTYEEGVELGYYIEEKESSNPEYTKISCPYGDKDHLITTSKTVTVTNIKPKSSMDLTIETKWINSSTNSEIRLSNVSANFTVYQVKKNGNDWVSTGVSYQVKLEKGQWKSENLIVGLPTFDTNNHELGYYIVEDLDSVVVPNGYVFDKGPSSVQTVGNESSPITGDKKATFTHTVTKTNKSFTVTKDWKNESNTDNLEIDVQLYKVTLKNIPAPSTTGQGINAPPTGLQLPSDEPLPEPWNSSIIDDSSKDQNFSDFSALVPKPQNGFFEYKGKWYLLLKDITGRNIDQFRSGSVIQPYDLLEFTGRVLDETYFERDGTSSQFKIKDNANLQVKEFLTGDIIYYNNTYYILQARNSKPNIPNPTNPDWVGLGDLGITSGSAFGEIIIPEYEDQDAAEGEEGVLKGDTYKYNVEQYNNPAQGSNGYYTLSATDDWKTTIRNLPDDGEYYAYEVNVRDTSKTGDASDVTSNYVRTYKYDQQTGGVIMTNTKKGSGSHKVIFRKVAKGSYTPLGGAAFEIHKDSKDGDKVSQKNSAGALITRYTSNESGVYFVGELDEGTYWIQEVQAPSGYGSNEKAWFKLEVTSTGVEQREVEKESST